MAYRLDLTSAWAKHDRAIEHIEALRSEIDDAKPNSFTFRQQFKPEDKAIVFYIESVVEIPQQRWGIIVGDVAHNLRGALDHLAWQLAIRHFDGLEPTDRKIIKAIQFPVVTDEGLWPNHVNRKYMRVSDAKKLEHFQPFKLGKGGRSGAQVHGLEALAGFSGLSNVDKHRTINVTFFAPKEAWILGMSLDGFRECIPIPGEGGNVTFTHTIVQKPPKPGHEVFRVFVTPTGPNPHVDFQPSIAGYIAIRERWDVLKELSAAVKGVEDVLTAFTEPL